MFLSQVLLLMRHCSGAVFIPLHDGAVVTLTFNDPFTSEISLPVWYIQF
jgi:hypothetical protein